MTVKSPAVNVFDAISIFQLPNLEHLKVVNLAPKITLSSGITIRDFPPFSPTKIKKLEFFIRDELDPYNMSYLFSRHPRLRQFTWAPNGPLKRTHGFRKKEHFGTNLTGYSEPEMLQTDKWVLNEARREDLA